MEKVSVMLPPKRPAFRSETVKFDPRDRAEAAFSHRLVDTPSSSTVRIRSQTSVECLSNGATRSVPTLPFQE